MTTTVSLAARDFIVIGCDSLATMSMDLLFPFPIATDFFDAEGNLKLGDDGKPLLTLAKLQSQAVSLPVNQLPDVTKIYGLAPVNAGLLFAGISRIGNSTIRNVVETFKSNEWFNAHARTATVEEISTRLKAHILEIYAREIENELARPLLEVLISGYSHDCWEPEVWRLLFYYKKKESKFDCDLTAEIERKSYNVVFGGQYDVIQRVVNGVDFASYTGLQRRARELLEDCHSNIESQMRAAGYPGPVPKPNFDDDNYDLFSKNWGNVNRMFSDIGSLSEQAGINFVLFLIEVMINSQEFSNSIPTVGGKVHVALLRKNEKLKWISKEGFTFRGEHVPTE